MFFIFGSPRSGTTLLAQCLNAHSEIVVPHETDFIIPTVLICNRVKNPEIGRGIIAEVVINSTLSNSLREYLRAETLRELVFSTEYHAGKILEAIYGAIAHAKKKKMAGDKTPNDIGYLPKLASENFWLPGTKIIHIVRDVRDMMTSLYETKWVNAASVLFSRQWSCDNVYLHFRFQNKSDRYLLVHYEEMVREPAKIFRKICQFLDVAFEKKMLLPENRHARYRKTAHHQNLFRPISDDRIGRYRDHLTADQLAGCEFHAQEGLETFGYSASPKVPATGPTVPEIKKSFRSLFRWK